LPSPASLWFAEAGAAGAIETTWIKLLRNHKGKWLKAPDFRVLCLAQLTEAVKINLSLNYSIFI